MPSYRGFGARMIAIAFKTEGPSSLIFRIHRWLTFLHNHAPNIAAMDLFVVYALVIIRLERRELVLINITENHTAEWIARQITKAFPGMRLRAT